jgi:uncharacterized protein (DUF58 family)
MKKRFKEKPLLWIPIWMALGSGIGVPINSIPIGVGLGTMIGFLFFLIITVRYKKKIC